MANEVRINRFDRERAVVNGGHWARMTLLERGVWVVLLFASDFDSGVVIMEQAEIARRAGISNNGRMLGACRAIGVALADDPPDTRRLGLCRTVERGGGWGRAAVRQMLAPEPAPGFVLEAGVGGVNTTPVSGLVVPNYRAGQRPAISETTGPVNDRYRAGHRPNTGPVTGPASHSSHIHTTTTTAKGAGERPPYTGPMRAVDCPSEVVVVALLRHRGLWKEFAELFARALAPAELDFEFRDLVNNPKGIRDRKAVYRSRLERLLNQKTPHPKEPPHGHRS